MNPFQKAAAARMASAQKHAAGLASNKNLRNYKRYKERAQTAASMRWSRKKVPPPPPPRTRRRNNTPLPPPPPPPKTPHNNRPQQPINSNYRNALKFFKYTNLTANTAARLPSNYRKMSLKLHPNRPGGSTAMFQNLGRHYAVLLSKRVF